MSGEGVGKDEVARNKGNKKSTRVFPTNQQDTSPESPLLSGGGGGEPSGGKECGCSGLRCPHTEGGGNPAEGASNPFT